jgi:hypothetical protein
MRPNGEGQPDASICLHGVTKLSFIPTGKMLSEQNLEISLMVRKRMAHSSVQGGGLPSTLTAASPKCSPKKGETINKK